MTSDVFSAIRDDLKQYEDEEELEKHKAPNERRITGSVTAATRRGRATSVPLIEAGGKSRRGSTAASAHSTAAEELIPAAPQVAWVRPSGRHQVVAYHRFNDFFSDFSLRSLVLALRFPFILAEFDGFSMGIVQVEVGFFRSGPPAPPHPGRLLGAGPHLAPGEDPTSKTAFDKVARE